MTTAPCVLSQIALHYLEVPTDEQWRRIEVQFTAAVKMG